MLRRTEGIVLRTAPVGEADLIVTYLTKDYGVVRVYAKSPRKTKSRFGSSLEPLTRSRISFWGKEDAALPRLTQSDILRPFHALRSSLHGFLNASELVELTLTLFPERVQDCGIYRLLVGVLEAMEGDCESILPRLSFKLKLLRASGYLPGLDSCGKCGRTETVFHIVSGAVLCEGCSEALGKGNRWRLSPGVSRLWSHLLIWEFSKLERLRPGQGLIRDLSTLLDRHVKDVTERELTTRSFRAP